MSPSIRKSSAKRRRPKLQPLRPAEAARRARVSLSPSGSIPRPSLRLTLLTPLRSVWHAAEVARTGNCPRDRRLGRRRALERRRTCDRRGSDEDVHLAQALAGSARQDGDGNRRRGRRRGQTWTSAPLCRVIVEEDLYHIDFRNAIWSVSRLRRVAKEARRQVPVPSDRLRPDSRKIGQ